MCADGFDFVADQPPDAVVMNEVIYYLPDPIAAVEHHARRLAPGGVVIVSIYARTWSSRRLLRALAARLDGRVQRDQIRPSGVDRGGVSAVRRLAGLVTGHVAQASLQISSIAEASLVTRLALRELDGRGAGEADPSIDRGIPPDRGASRRRR